MRQPSGTLDQGIDFALDAFTTRKEVAHIETSPIFTFRCNPDVPIYRKEDED